MAQNMYKWAKLAGKYNADATLYLNPQDQSAISKPEWEEFSGEFSDVLDGKGFLEENVGLILYAKVIQPENEGGELWAAYQDELPMYSWRRWVKKIVASISPEHGLTLYSSPAAKELKKQSPSVRHYSLIHYQGAYPYFRWAKLLADHDVIYIASTPFPAYASGKPYCICPVGGDLQFDCGRTDDHGETMRLAFSEATFIFASNPHVLGHCRRLGFTNALYLPYPMDSDHYCPGEGRARNEWKDRFGGKIFVLTTARIDSRVKGQDDDFFDMLAKISRDRSDVRFIFLGWGNDADNFNERVSRLQLHDRLIMLSPVGKQRLLDYYRSCDIVLDQFVYGYFGATALEAASVGKPIIMNQRIEQYAPLYSNDVAPVLNASNHKEIRDHLYSLIDSPKLRDNVGSALRNWLIRNHGEQRTVPLMLALLQLAADKAVLPKHLDNPLQDPLTATEHEYHIRCHQ